MKDFDLTLEGCKAGIVIVVILGLAIYGLFSLILEVMSVLMAAGL